LTGPERRGVELPGFGLLERQGQRLGLKRQQRGPPAFGGGAGGAADAGRGEQQQGGGGEGDGPGKSFAQRGHETAPVDESLVRSAAPGVGVRGSPAPDGGAPLIPRSSRPYAQRRGSDGRCGSGTRQRRRVGPTGPSQCQDSRAIGTVSP